MNCRITEQVFEVIRSLQEEQKKPKDYGTGQLLFQGEVEFLCTLDSSPESKVSDLSEELGITKGAVTQMAGKLQEKDLIQPYQRPGNKKEKYFRLTDGGETVIRGYRQMHESANARICTYFRSLSPEETALISDFLTHLRECVPFCEFTCRQLAAGRERKD